MPADNIRELKLPDGTVVRGIELGFEIVKEDWNEYLLDDGTKLRVKNVLIRALRLVDEEGNPQQTPMGDPEIFINSTVTVVASQ